MRKKAQIKMTETISILVIFFILLLFGLVFYAQFQKSALLKQKQQSIEKQAISLSLRVNYLQELRCEETVKTGTCIDLQKIKALKKIINTEQDNGFYSNLFASADIYFEDLINNINYNIYNSSFANFTKRTRVRTPVLLRDVIADKDYFGVLYVDLYT